MQDIGYLVIGEGGSQVYMPLDQVMEGEIEILDIEAHKGHSALGPAV